jgi:cell division protease FtsH
MVTRWGMDPQIGPLRLEHGVEGEESLRRADGAMRALVTQAERTARAMLAARRSGLERLAAALLERERLEGSEVEALLELTPGEKPYIIGANSRGDEGNQ